MLCQCNATRRGAPTCRAVQILPSREMTCGRAVEFIECVRAAIVDGCESVGDLVVDAEALIAALRARGWRVSPPRGKMAIATVEPPVAQS